MLEHRYFAFCVMDHIQSLNVKIFLKMQFKQHLNHAKQSGICFNCILPFTRNHTCSKQVCHQCNKRHHILEHLDRQIQLIIDKGSVTNCPADPRDTSTGRSYHILFIQGQTYVSLSKCQIHCGSSD